MSQLQSRVMAYNSLPKGVRERFIECTAARQAPTPILAERLGMGGAAFGWGFLCFVALGGLALMLGPDFGHPTSSMAIQSPGFIVVYVLCIFTAVYSVLAIMRRKRLLRALPYLPGRYLFPMDFVDARTDTLRITPMATMVDFRGVHHHTNGAYTHTEFTFRFQDGTSQTLTIRGKDQADRALADLRTSQSALSAAIEARDAQRIWALDVFFEARMNDWQPEAVAGAQQNFAQYKQGAVVDGPSATPIAGIFHKAALVALGVAVIGVPLWYVRNVLSDEATFAAIGKEGSVYMVEHYIEHGGRHAKEAKKKLLPRAALREAKQAGTVTALREVAKKYSGSDTETDARAEIKTLFAKTIAEFHKQAAGDNPEMLAFMDRLFTYLEKNDSPPVLVRFAKPSAGDMAAADDELKKIAGSQAVPIAGHFDEARSAKRQGAIVRYLQDAFSKIFPADVMTLQEGTALAPNEAPKQPTIEIHYDVSPSGDVYVEEGTGRKFVGIRISFAVSMRLPGDDKAFAFPLEVEPPDRFTVGASPLDQYGIDDLPNHGSDAGAVYDAMALNAFGQLATKLRTVYFRPGTEAFQGGPGDGSRAPSGVRPSQIPGGTEL
jgi:hypothetical protein